jgi:guanosine-3',5'-bis(diphosphate) 3'-pyrophosphohydrolase
VATELAYWHMDAISIASGLMHDVLEDTGTTKLQLAAEFDDTIADIVDGLSKLEKLEYSSKEEHQAESFRKMILAMIKDIRVIIIKLSDRLHNMRTLGAVRPDKRRRIANETLEIYAQLANRIGLNEVYRELQDLAFKSLHPNRYKVLTRALEASRRNRRDVVGKVLTTFSQCLVAFNIEAQIKGREKNLFSIHSKMMQKNLRFAEVMDIYGFRVIVNNVPTCYTALGALHSIYKPKPGKIKDYIAIPKNNGYQSIHTTLVGPYGLPIEVQIRTREMDEIAEGGVASHWMYKSNGASFDAASVRTHQWMQNILDLQAESDNAIEFLEHVKVDLFPDEVYLFTPKGKIIVLPRGATPVDFAYAVHTDIGNHCVAARVNNNMVPLRTVLNTGDTIEVITSTKSNPNPAWLNFVVSGRARSGIRAWIKTMNRHDAVILGESLLNKALVSLLPKQLLLSEELRDQYLSQLAHKNTNFEDVLYEVGMGRFCQWLWPKIWPNWRVKPLTKSATSIPLKSTVPKMATSIWPSVVAPFLATPSVLNWQKTKASWYTATNVPPFWPSMQTTNCLPTGI